MKGKVIIETFDRGAFSLDLEIEGFTHKDRLMMVDALVESMNFDELDRVELGLLIATGGFKATHKDAMKKVVLSDQLSELIRKRRGNET